MPKPIYVHLVTDSTGETILHICKAVMSQFKNISIEQLLWPFVNSSADVDAIMYSVERYPGIVMYTILRDELIEYLHRKVNDVGNSVVVPALSHIISKFSSAFNVRLTGLSGREISGMNHQDRRIDAIMYTTEHDDGQSLENLNDADMILIGVSRTSKTPTSIYLSYRGFKVANIPFITTNNMYNLAELTKPLIIGLTINSVRLSQIRSSRNLSNNNLHISQAMYTNLECIELELKSAYSFFCKLNCHVIDITDKSIEEISTAIVKMHIRNGGKIDF